VSALLELRGVSKTFGGLAAVADVSFDVPEGSVVGLIGPNGAGKTTTFNLITGQYRMDAGDISFQGRSVKGLRTHRIVARGIARTFQNIRLFQELTAVENVLAGRHCRTRAGLLAALVRPPAAVREERGAVDRAMDELAYVGLAGKALETAKGLPYGDQRRLEIARALATDPKLIATEFEFVSSLMPDYIAPTFDGIKLILENFGKEYPDAPKRDPKDFADGSIIERLKQEKFAEGLRF